MAAKFIEDFQASLRRLLVRMRDDLEGQDYPVDPRFGYADIHHRPSFRIYDLPVVWERFPQRPAYRDTIVGSQEFQHLFENIREHEAWSGYYLADASGQAIVEAQQEGNLWDFAISMFRALAWYLIHVGNTDEVVDAFVDLSTRQAQKRLDFNVRSSPLYGCTMEPDIIEFEQSVLLRKPLASDQERWRERRLDEFAARGPWPRLDLGQFGAIFETFTETRLGVQLAYRLDDAESRVRLLTNLLFGRDLNMEYLDYLRVSWRGGTGSGVSARPNEGFGKPLPLHLTRANCDELVRLWPKTMNVERLNRFNLAARRYLLAVGRPDTHDRLLDLWIALEALFSPGKEGEIAFRLALRAASYLSGDPAAMKADFDFLNASYDKRSKLVHGDTVIVDEAKDVQPLEGRLQHILRRIIEEERFAPEAIESAVLVSHAQQLHASKVEP